ncbi:hypothetical protein LDENG_00250030 [Lucifuga dentata]|nr:hypothetical protein LDENG_00250030 [Lucifuga dentata]
MAVWPDTTLFLSILFLSCCCTGILAQIPVNCCLEVKEAPIPQRIAIDYHQQISGHGCSIDAIIFVTRKGKNLCAPVNKEWVCRLMRHVDNIKERCKENNYTGSRCRDLKPK